MRNFRRAITVLALFFVLQTRGETNNVSTAGFSFVVAGDMRKFASGVPEKRYFDGACEAMKEIGPGAFLLSPGDCDPPDAVRSVIDRYLGTNFLWYPIIGNHELEKAENMTWFRKWAERCDSTLRRRGPPGAERTIYSFDFGNSHFVGLNEYFDGHSETSRNDDLPDATLDWLEQDLSATKQPLVWVFGHKPLKSVADMDTGRLRHDKDSVSTNAVHFERFIRLMKEHRVRAYICGHTHNSSITRVEGVWQADSGQCRGAGDTGTPSTFLKIRISGLRAAVDVYRADPNGKNYKLRKTVDLD